MDDNSNKLCEEGTIREEKRIPEDNLTGRNMMNVADSGQTRRTLVYSHPQSPQQISSKTAACCYQNIGKTQWYPVLQSGRGLQWIGWSNCICYPIDSECTWNAYVGDKKVPDTCDILARFRSSPLTDDKLSDMIIAYWQCSFMHRQSRWEILSQHAGMRERSEEWENGDVVAFIDKSSVTDHSGKQYQCTVRRVDCDMLCERSSQYPLRCKLCELLGSTLRSLVSCQSNESDSHISASSHTR